MTKIKPFKAFIYNQEKIKGLEKAVCPPYDVISKEKQEYYHDLSSYNLIHILLGKDIPGEDKYVTAKNTLREWIKEKILIQEDEPAIYFYSQQYNIRGEKKTRLGFIALMRLEEKNSTVFGHEHTRLEPKEDRLKLIKQVKGNLSPIFAIMLDNKRVIQRTFRNDISNLAPFMEVVDDEKTVHKLWRLDSPGTIENIKSGLFDENIFIADGHHRFEVACAYRDEMKQKLGARFSGDEDFNFILTYFTNTDARGLTISPIHRLLKLDAKMDIEKIQLLLSEYFDIEEFKDKAKFFFLMEKSGRTQNVLGMYKDKKYYLLRLKNIKLLDKMISDKPKVYRVLDVSILNYIVLKKIFGVDIENKELLNFSQDAEEFIEKVDTDRSKIAFFLNPPKMEQIISVALNGERMPSKSTYFYPKVLSGLVINKHEE